MRPSGTFLGGIGAQQVGAALNGYLILIGQFVDPFQADIAPGSNIVVPNRYADYLIIMLKGLNLFPHRNLLTPAANAAQLV